MQVEGFSYWHATLYYLVIFRLKVGGDNGEDLLGTQPLHSVLPESTKKSAVEQEPIHTSTYPLRNENSSDDCSANQQRFSFPSFSPPLTYNRPPDSKVHLQGSYCEGAGRGSIPWDRCGSKGACGCCSKVKWINLNWVHSRSWQFYLEKVSAHLFRLPPGLSSLSGSMGSPAETREHKGKQGLTHLTSCWLLTCHIFHHGQRLTNRHSSSSTAFVLQFCYAEHSIGSLPLALSPPIKT